MSIIDCKGNYYHRGGYQNSEEQHCGEKFFRFKFKPRKTVCREGTAAYLNKCRNNSILDSRKQRLKVIYDFNDLRIERKCNLIGKPYSTRTDER